jgi:hypothetical protein
MNSINRSSWNDLQPITSAEEQRKEIKKHIEDFIAKGGKIITVAPGETCMDPQMRKKLGLPGPGSTYPNRRTRAKARAAGDWL